VNVGQKMHLGDVEETKDFEPKVTLPFKELDVEYVPNIRPNRLWRASGLGVADIQGSETLLDALDETFASWMRDVRLAKARIIVPSEYLRWPTIKSGGTAPYFDLDQEIYTPMEMMPDPEASAKAMMAHQFEIRYIEHRDTALAFIERIVSNAGYVPSTIGISGVNSNPLRGTTGTALRISEHKTILTQRRKAAQWRRPIANILYRMQLIDKEIFSSKTEPIKPVVEMADSVIDQPLELAQTALAMKSAESASTETRVRILHPSWTEAEITSEVVRIQDEAQSSSWQVVPPKFGDPENPDQASTQNMPRKNPMPGLSNGPPPPQNPPTAKKAR
jgi:A118 family predicted phage portal protein